MTAFFNLTSDRQIGEIQGAIPWTSIVHYADRRGLDEELSEAFEYIIRAMDNAYLEYSKPKRQPKRLIGKK